MDRSGTCVVKGNAESSVFCYCFGCLHRSLLYPQRDFFFGRCSVLIGIPEATACAATVVAPATAFRAAAPTSSANGSYAGAAAAAAAAAVAAAAAGTFRRSSTCRSHAVTEDFQSIPRQVIMYNH